MSAMPAANRPSVPGRMETNLSAFAADVVKMGSMTMTLAPFSFASETKW